MKIQQKTSKRSASMEEVYTVVNLLLAKPTVTYGQHGQVNYRYTRGRHGGRSTPVAEIRCRPHQPPQGFLYQ
ncbi:hypothetical protein [Deinococcus cellulosilyticus]|uniref:Uncharacterized protein n=1 Tax=Deinococcus cellulosilyticus (strain DSM 18568 / NBRC 106333 / KACC 11606 / 5516J-15) TaxID=1223518 RepID=A0A511NA02_DEIC1|nr:hypothetical protein [Deinococcus cellulosilyticus]GEM49653.1 hypothetical protein DC3_52880 [Deinococcus cellulosilyticus NBRC 106333 = KACC 11606]